MLMVRDNLFTAPIGLAFLASAWLKRPLIYYMAGAVLARQRRAMHTPISNAPGSTSM